MDINSFIVYGHAGTGKTFAVAQAMPDALWVVTRKTNLSGYNTFLRKEPEQAKALGLAPIPAVVPISKKMAAEDGSFVNTDILGVIHGMVKEYVSKARKGETKVKGIVFDELSVIAKWAYEAIGQNERNGFEIIKRIKSWVGDLCEISEVTGLPMAFICHSKDPAYFEDGPQTGRVKYKGGPAMPVGTMIADVCALPDAVLQFEVVKDGMKTKRVMHTQADPLWERKCRIYGTDSTMEPDLRALLSEGGWDFPRVKATPAAPNKK